MMPAQIIVEIVEEGGEIRLEDGRLKVKGIPARLVPAIREHKAALLALLSSSAPDDYDRQERAAIMEYDGELTRQEAERLAGVLTITHRDPNARFREAVESYPTLSVQHSADMAPSRVSCGTCLHFLPGQPLPGQSLGACSLTGAGPPSVASGYKAAYPMAKRYCDSHEMRTEP